jgi:CMP/dCMP kinase
MAPWIVTIDGPAASGKSTVARRLARRIDAAFLDTGAMYRAVTFAAMQDAADLNDESQLVAVMDRHTFEFEAVGETMRVLVDGAEVTDRIRTPELTENVRYIAASPPMRTRLVEMQRRFARRHGRVVTEGRDQGTVAFPDADVKFYLVADTTERARRRQLDLRAQGVEADREALRQAIESRDRSDESRAVGPLKPAPDAIRVDTTRLTIEEVVEHLLNQLPC